MTVRTPPIAVRCLASPVTTIRMCNLTNTYDEDVKWLHVLIISLRTGDSVHSLTVRGLVFINASVQPLD